MHLKRPIFSAVQLHMLDYEFSGENRKEPHRPPPPPRIRQQKTGLYWPLTQKQPVPSPKVGNQNVFTDPPSLPEWYNTTERTFIIELFHIFIGEIFISGFYFRL